MTICVRHLHIQDKNNDALKQCTKEINQIRNVDLIASGFGGSSKRIGPVHMPHVYCG